jgi:DnaJ-class molecular chaperone
MTDTSQQAARVAEVVAESSQVSSPPRCTKHNVVMDIYNDCSTCRGDGMVEDMDEYGPNPGMETCWSCRGSGVSVWPDCWLCLEEDDEY